MTFNSKLLTICLAFALSNTASAVDLNFGLNYGIGGDVLVPISNGADIKLGDGLEINLGADFPISENLSIQSSIGYKFKTEDVSVSGTIVEFKNNSIPVTVGAKFKLNKLGFEAGAITLLSPELSLSSSSGSSTFELESNIGAYAGIIYKLNRKTEFGIRSVVGSTLVPTTNTSTSLNDASSIAFIMRSYF